MKAYVAVSTVVYYFMQTLERLDVTPYNSKLYHRMKDYHTYKLGINGRLHKSGIIRPWKS